MANLRNFSEGEFNNFAKMDQEFLKFLDDVRTLAGMPFYLTSDYRSPQRNAEIGGHVASLHPKGMAVDFVTQSCRSRLAQDYYADIYKIMWAIVKVTDAQPSHNRAVQFEIVKGPNDWHLHLGLHPKGAPKESKVVVALD